MSVSFVLLLNLDNALKFLTTRNLKQQMSYHSPLGILLLKILKLRYYLYMSTGAQKFNFFCESQSEMYTGRCVHCWIMACLQ